MERKRIKRGTDSRTLGTKRIKFLSTPQDVVIVVGGRGCGNPSKDPSMATPVKVYGPPMSTAVARVLACLLEKDVNFQLIPINMSKGEHKKPDYLKIQVPFIYL